VNDYFRIRFVLEPGAVEGLSMASSESCIFGQIPVTYYSVVANGCGRW